MTTSKHKWHTPVFFFAMAAFFLTGGFRFVLRGHIRGVDLSPDTDPYRFWGLVVLSFIMGTFGFWRGIVELLAYLRERKIQSGLR
jgi:hypothetical protein